MQAVSLGNTNLIVTRIGLGLAALGRPGYINLGHAADLGADYDVAHMESRTHGVLDAAWDMGVRYFDAARSYGKAEDFLGSWLRERGIDAGAAVVASKWGYTYTADWQVEAEKHEVKSHTIDVVDRQWVESRRLLGNHLAVYQIHSATLDSGVLDNTDVLKRLSTLKKDNVLVGLTLSGRGQAATLQRAMGIRVDGVRLFDTVQATWNLLETSAGPTLRSARDQGIGVIVKEALANGRLTERNESPEFSSQRQALSNEAARLGTTTDGLALAAVLAQPWADVVLSGAATVAQLEANLGGLHVKWDDDAAERLRALSETPKDYWRTRTQLTWN